MRISDWSSDVCSSDLANYTRLWSDRDDPATGESIAIDYQPTYVYNVGLTQNIPSWNASFGFSYQKQGESRFVTYGEIESQLYDGNLEVFIEKRLSKNVVMRLTGTNLLDADSLQAEAGFDGDNGAEIIANQAAYAVDAYEVERENSSPRRSEEHTSELQSLMRISYAVFCLKKKKDVTKQKQAKT